MKIKKTRTKIGQYLAGAIGTSISLILLLSLKRRCSVVSESFTDVSLGVNDLLLDASSLKVSDPV